MLSDRWTVLAKMLSGLAFFIGAAWVAWHGRTYQGVDADMVVPVMCLMVALTFSLTGFALILRTDD